ncbi:subunit of 2-[hydroxy(phenyl)methyl]-succinyl-CoA DH [Sinorhizobium meliloti CCNWSX0020]|uniref:Subunit of 2-[hydroxy(Phenyl)methyl]-succinyl-CoA DH n=1 Tax=Sinorhizobium meliloti CCNWSX0020 TaxID=1107881 RepID=H0G2E7_RHIML|nr:SDR family NAD(P)-dependent oxidoreductase [Sinorhizobium meliloti]EHK76504.1 subunit of 2-[hydroxy(phenyl)methyl]-succinyl-CoA DH [Sinorhizobium meliloti CCNWSX0020]
MTSFLKHGIITGAAGGIARELTLTLASAGMNLVASDLNAQRLKDTVAEANAMGARVIGVAGDISDPALPSKLCRAAVDNFGGLDLLLNCSGFLKDARIQKMPLEVFQQLIAVNLLGPLRLSIAAGEIMKTSGRGRIISIASRAWLGTFGSSGYSCAKGGIVGSHRALALKLAPYGVTVNTIAPGFIETPMAMSLPPHILERVLDSIPVGRPGKANDIAALVLYLASEGSGYVTGQTIVACGGRSIGDPIAKKKEEVEG